ncbi:DUF4232 domain-containing protein [Streptomyces sp. FL07-04A]|uniref:DUF4232 domain-containing protein n=1 Tax=Streptomyces sp. FL07-04A TaxID=3028658 RepID=UPI0029A1E852|nr:DUF4232 domain-containing protein [Streptomyces sp. FL07-04A]MDX3577231.1 DUF4232 domain-containing protein [Streptomyces sp. FL07-04A]
MNGAGVNGGRGTTGKRGGAAGRVRKAAAAAAVVVSAALAVTACQPTESPSKPAQSTPADSAPATSPSASAATPTASHPAASAPPTASAPGAPTASAATASAAPGASASASASASVPAAAAACAAKNLEVSAWQAAERPVGTGTGAAIVQFVNVGGKACVLKGHPSVAGAGNGSPEHNSPLAVTASGPASPVTLAPGGKAWTKLTFVQVHGEADGYCKSGAVPSVYPTVVVGLPGSGSHQVALDDGQFAECDNKVTVTAVSAAKP